MALKVFEENYESGSYSAEALGKYQLLWESQFGREIEHACSIQRRVYGNRMGRLWKLIIAELNKNRDLKRLVTDELSRDMSIANMVEKIPLGVKLRLAAKYSRQN